MTATNIPFYRNLIFHVLLGIAFFLFRPLSMGYAVLILILGIYFIIKNKNANNESLYAAAYIVGAEVLLRMTGGYFSYEFGKYAVTLFILLGAFYNGFSKNAISYWFYLLLLLPGILVATETLNLESNVRTRIIFNLSGPICLGIASMYTFNRKITLKQLNDMLFMVGLPILSCSVYLMLYVPDLKEAVTGTESNVLTSGGFGPNQVATVLGLGMFVFFSRLLLESKTKFVFVINLIIAFNLTYRGLVTFSRGGMITGFAMILILLVFIYLNTKSIGRFKLSLLFGFMSLALVATWFYASLQTGGLIDKRYANQDSMGRIKESQFTGRERIWDSEVEDFMESPIFGVGVGKAKELREDRIGISVASHSEITRTLAEHGAMGIISLLIVFFTPIFLYLDNKQHIYMFCFLAFWLLTINHAAMRIAAPAFVYSLALLKVRFDDQEPSALPGNMAK